MRMLLRQPPPLPPLLLVPSPCASVCSAAFACLLFYLHAPPRLFSFSRPPHSLHSQLLHSRLLRPHSLRLHPSELSLPLSLFGAQPRLACAPLFAHSPSCSTLRVSPIAPQKAPQRQFSTFSSDQDLSIDREFNLRELAVRWQRATDFRRARPEREKSNLLVAMYINS